MTSRNSPLHEKKGKRDSGQPGMASHPRLVSLRTEGVVERLLVISISWTLLASLTDEANQTGRRIGEHARFRVVLFVRFGRSLFFFNLPVSNLGIHDIFALLCYISLYEECMKTWRYLYEDMSYRLLSLTSIVLYNRLVKLSRFETKKICKILVFYNRQVQVSSCSSYSFISPRLSLHRM